MKANVTVSISDLKEAESRIRSIMYDLGDEQPLRMFEQADEKPAVSRQRIYSAVQGLRQLLNFIQLY